MSNLVWFSPAGKSPIFPITINLYNKEQKRIYKTALEFSKFYGKPRLKLKIVGTRLLKPVENVDACYDFIIDVINCRNIEYFADRSSNGVRIYKMCKAVASLLDKYAYDYGARFCDGLIEGLKAVGSYRTSFSIYGLCFKYVHIQYKLISNKDKFETDIFEQYIPILLITFDADPDVYYDVACRKDVYTMMNTLFRYSEEFVIGTCNMSYNWLIMYDESEDKKHLEILMVPIKPFAEIFAKPFEQYIKHLLKDYDDDLTINTIQIIIITNYREYSYNYNTKIICKSKITRLYEQLKQIKIEY